MAWMLKETGAALMSNLVGKSMVVWREFEEGKSKQQSIQVREDECCNDANNINDSTDILALHEAVKLAIHRSFFSWLNGKELIWLQPHSFEWCDGISLLWHCNLTALGSIAATLPRAMTALPINCSLLLNALPEQTVCWVLGPHFKYLLPSKEPVNIQTAYKQL